MTLVKSFFQKLLNNILLKFKNFFALNNLKRHIIGFSIALVLLIVDIIIAYNLGYATAHKKIYEATSYVKVLIIAFGLYLLRLFLTNKKSSADIVIVLYLFLS